MSFLVIVISLCAQWFLTIKVPYKYPWSEKYLAIMRKRFFSLTHDHRLFSFLLLTLPPVIAASFIFVLTYHFFGHIGYSILSLLLLWYCIDLTFLKQAAATQISSTDLFLKSYQKIFAVLFWYFVFGPGGLIIYEVVSALHAQLKGQKYFVLTSGILDWVPIRLTGLSFALAGNFGAVFNELMTFMFQRIADNQNQVITFGELALSTESTAAGLIKRALIIWVVAMGLISLGVWI